MEVFSAVSDQEGDKMKENGTFSKLPGWYPKTVIVPLPD